MKVFLTGGTGFVGGEVLRRLLAAGHSVRCLVRAGSESKLEQGGEVEIHTGDATDPQSLDGALAGCEAVIHLVGIIREFPSRGVSFESLHVVATRNVLEAVKSQGVRRYLHMSANGTRAEAVTDYHRTKWAAEELVRESGLDWTIFRPSLIYGPGSEFIRLLRDLVRSLPVVPVIGDGRYRMAPVSVADVAGAFAIALEKDETVGRAFPLCGAQEYSYDELLDLFGKALGKSRVCKLHQPVWMVRPVVALGESLPFFPVTLGQMTMLLEGNVCQKCDWETFDITPSSFGRDIEQCSEAKVPAASTQPRRRQ